MGGELAQVALVGRERVLGQPPLDPQVVEPGLQRLISNPKVHVPRSRLKKSRSSRPSRTTSRKPPVTAKRSGVTRREL
jgi:hypothetical protein